MKQILHIILIGFFLCAGMHAPVSAQIALPEPPRLFQPGDKVLDFQSQQEAKNAIANQGNANLLLDAPSQVMDILFQFFAIIGTLAAVYGGYLMVFSKGDAKKLQQGFQMLIYTAIGMIIAGSAWFIVRFILNFHF